MEVQILWVDRDIFAKSGTVHCQWVSLNSSLRFQASHNFNFSPGNITEGSSVWNSLPVELQDPNMSIGSFRRSLKTWLFSRTSTFSALEVFSCNVHYKSMFHIHSPSHWAGLYISNSASMIFLKLYHNIAGIVLSSKAQKGGVP